MLVALSSTSLPSLPTHSKAPTDPEKGPSNVPMVPNVHCAQKILPERTGRTLSEQKNSTVPTLYLGTGLAPLAPCDYAR